MAHRSDLDKASKHEAGWREVELGEVLEQLQDRQQVDLRGCLRRPHESALASLLSISRIIAT
jgi:hypothetical protein